MYYIIYSNVQVPCNYCYSGICNSKKGNTVRGKGSLRKLKVYSKEHEGPGMIRDFTYKAEIKFWFLLST